MTRHVPRWIARHRRDLILWFGRLFTVAFTVAMLIDLTADGTMSREIRQVAIGVTALVFVLILGWQARIAYRYEGVPLIPVPFRWVVATWFASLASFVAWSLAISWWPELYSEYASAVMWWQLAVATMWFCARWITVDDVHEAGAGETGGSA